MKLVGISGSLQARSSNTALLEVTRAVAGEGVEIEVFAALAAVPAFNPDTDPAPPSIEAFRSLVQSADGLVIATPEYAFGLPGSLKNLLDWLVGSGELYGKPVVVLSAGPERRAGHERACRSRTHVAGPGRSACSPRRRSRSRRAFEAGRPTIRRFASASRRRSPRSSLTSERHAWSLGCRRVTRSNCGRKDASIH